MREPAPVKRVYVIRLDVKRLATVGQRLQCAADKNAGPAAVAERPDIDRWILSDLQDLIQKVTYAQNQVVIDRLIAIIDTFRKSGIDALFMDNVVLTAKG